MRRNKCEACKTATPVTHLLVFSTDFPTRTGWVQSTQYSWGCFTHIETLAATLRLASNTRIRLCVVLALAPPYMVELIESAMPEGRQRLTFGAPKATRPPDSLTCEWDVTDTIGYGGRPI